MKKLFLGLIIINLCITKDTDEKEENNELSYGNVPVLLELKDENKISDNQISFIKAKFCNKKNEYIDKNPMELVMDILKNNTNSIYEDQYKIMKLIVDARIELIGDSCSQEKKRNAELFILAVLSKDYSNLLEKVKNSNIIDYIDVVYTNITLTQREIINQSLQLAQKYIFKKNIYFF